MVEPFVEMVAEISAPDLHDLCDATDSAILDGGGFGWLKPPPRQTLERYWRGVLVVPDRTLFLGRVDGTVCGAAQLMRPPSNNEAQAAIATLTGNFVAPWARGQGVARMLAHAVVDEARAQGFSFLSLDVRETQTVAIQHYENLGFTCWGRNPTYAMVDGEPVAGRYYTKDLRGKS